MASTKAVSLAGSLVAEFAALIERGDLPPGGRYPTEREITERFGVSRTVTREAFARLAAQGLLESRRGSGAYVPTAVHYRAFQVTPDDLAELEDVLALLEMRAAVEADMAALAARRRTKADLDVIRGHLAAMESAEDEDVATAADRRFHAAIAAATGNAYYVRFADFLGLRLIPARRTILDRESDVSRTEYARMIEAEHRAIVDAIAAGDEAAASAAARAHMQSSYRRHAELRDRVRS
ncbi:FadR/GntR family transcriptional regulator [Sphingomonas silueang]|uniref:FadR/GntR family transcriptional regulator n=1 Tax=Sphingomonas silueang TaxID=3156617 RepID=UPI0032B4DA3E